MHEACFIISEITTFWRSCCDRVSLGIMADVFSLDMQDGPVDEDHEVCSDGEEESEVGL